MFPRFWGDSCLFASIRGCQFRVQVSHPSPPPYRNPVELRKTGGGGPARDGLLSRITGGGKRIGLRSRIWKGWQTGHRWGAAFDTVFLKRNRYRRATLLQIDDPLIWIDVTDLNFPIALIFGQHH